MNTFYNLKTNYIVDVNSIESLNYNIGWTLGNDCPYKCRHCYSMSAREKGMDLSKEIVDRVISELKKLKPNTINLGGNEPLFTNGINPQISLLPYILRQITSNSIDVGVTSSGITVTYLKENHNEEFKMLNDIDISIDSPYEDEHNRNRGAKIFHIAQKALGCCAENDIDRTIIMCAMNWNFTKDRIVALVDLAKRYGAHVRINSLRPTEEKHMRLLPSFKQFYDGFSLLMEMCEPIDLTDPVLSGITEYNSSKRCPCGRTSFRIHSITPDGKIPISPCVYLHDYKVGDILHDDILELIGSQQFRDFRLRNEHPELVDGCADCRFINICGGGCASRAYLYNLNKYGVDSLFVRDPLCFKDTDVSSIFPKGLEIPKDINLVHKDYLCTWIGKPK